MSAVSEVNYVSPVHFLEAIETNEFCAHFNIGRFHGI